MFWESILLGVGRDLGDSEVFFPSLLHLIYLFFLSDCRRLCSWRKTFSTFVSLSLPGPLTPPTDFWGSQTSHLPIKGHSLPPTALPFYPYFGQPALLPALSQLFLRGQSQRQNPHPPFPEYQSEFGVCREMLEFGAISCFLERLSRSS